MRAVLRQFTSAFVNNIKIMYRTCHRNYGWIKTYITIFIINIWGLTLKSLELLNTINNIKFNLQSTKFR